MARTTSNGNVAEKSSANLGSKADFGREYPAPFRCDLHPDIRTDYVLANDSMSSNQSGDCPALEREKSHMSCTR